MGSERAGQTWVPVATAPDQLTAELWRGILEAEAILATISAEDVVSFLGVSSRPCRVLVPEGLVSEARACLEATVPALDPDDAPTGG